MAGDLSARQPSQPDANGTAKSDPNGICNRVSQLAAPVYKWLRQLDEYAEGNPVEGVLPKLLRPCKAHGEHEQAKGNHVVQFVCAWGVWQLLRRYQSCERNQGRQEDGDAARPEGCDQKFSHAWPAIHY